MDKSDSAPKPVNYLESLLQSRQIVGTIRDIEANPPTNAHERALALNRLNELLDEKYIGENSTVSGDFYPYDSDDHEVYRYDETSLRGQPAIFYGADITNIFGECRVVFVFDAVIDVEAEDIQPETYAASINSLNEFEIDPLIDSDECQSEEVLEFKPVDYLHRSSAQLHDKSASLGSNPSRAESIALSEQVEEVCRPVVDLYTDDIEIDASQFFRIPKYGPPKMDWADMFVDDPSPEGGPKIEIIGKVVGGMIPKTHPAFSSEYKLTGDLSYLNDEPHLIVDGHDQESIYLVPFMYVGLLLK